MPISGPVFTMSEYGRLKFQCFSKWLEKVRDNYGAAELRGGAAAQWERWRGGCAAWRGGCFGPIEKLPHSQCSSFCITFVSDFDLDYSIISVTTPEPTVLPPSLIANLSPSSIAIGVIREIVIVMLSPGMHISTPSGSARSPVTSVVLK